MKHETFHNATFKGQSDTAAPVRDYLCAHRDALSHAADLLGGNEAAKSVDWLADALAQQTPASRRADRLLDDLLDLLSLKNVGDPDRPESGYFSLICPADPAVEEIFLLTDGLSQAREEMRERERRFGSLDAANNNRIELGGSKLESRNAK
ncbi:hypothetical protein GLP59_07110 [Sulfitobacter sp. M220]|jgi:hypothetical protein|uniref:hypothetical protein n=1 Tax=Sulfitobacter sp. M220 TaxID=2675333 RepID=UPI001F2FB56D|nr:hypothetical protein [Sulfitobacter sp. M220]MCF7777418.1 hypothetical protein [Sulfitobacter sp. M220]